jgi:hypothetical protein
MRYCIYYGCALSRLRFALACVFAAMTAASLNAQWPAFVRQETPRTPDGKPDLNAPPPRLPNGKIDFSGTWESRQPPSGRPGPMVPNLNPATDPPLAAFFNVGQNFKGGLPFTPWAAELRKQRMAANSKDNPDAHCLPLGFMQLHTHSQPRKIVQSANDVVIMYEANGGLRNSSALDRLALLADDAFSFDLLDILGRAGNSALGVAHVHGDRADLFRRLHGQIGERLHIAADGDDEAVHDVANEVRSNMNGFLHSRQQSL